MRMRAIGMARAALLTAGFVALGVSAVSPANAFANATNGDGSVLGGNQIYGPISTPVNVCGNAIAVLGTSAAGCKGGAKVKNGSDGGNQTSGKNSAGGGNQVNTPIKSPVDVCGNAVAVVGQAIAGCQGQGGGYHSRTPQHGTGNPVSLGLPELPATQYFQDMRQVVGGEKIRPAAATELMSTGMEGASLYVLAVAMLLAGVSPAMALARRVRPLRPALNSRR